VEKGKRKIYVKIAMGFLFVISRPRFAQIACVAVLPIIQFAMVKYPILNQYPSLLILFILATCVIAFLAMIRKKIDRI
jgi:hypothetical protein